MPVAAILGFDDVYASVLGGYADMLQVANAHLRKQGGRDAGQFEWHFLSADGQPVRASNGLELAMQPLPPRRRYDLVFIPSLHYRGWRQFQSFLGRQQVVRDWLVHQWSQGAWLSANCTGTFRDHHLVAGTALPRTLSQCGTANASGSHRVGAAGMRWRPCHVSVAGGTGTGALHRRSDRAAMRAQHAD
jgi:hypothetical protein